MARVIPQLRGGVLVLLAAMLGCEPKSPRDAYSAEFGCPEGGVTITPLGDDRFRASGCGAAALYRCSASSCRGEQAEAGGSRSNGAGAGRKDPRATFVATPDGSLVSLDVQLDGGVILKLRAAPASNGETAQLKLQRDEASAWLTNCRVDLLVDGSLVTLPPPRYSRERNKSSLLMPLKRDLLRELARAEGISVRACTTRWELDAVQLAGVRDFALRYEKELAWLSDRDPIGGALVPPLDGWTEWHVREELPVAESTAAPLEPSELFKLVSPAVLRVEAITTSGVSQGSGVALSPSRAATNCHVLERALKIIVKQGESEWVAHLEASAPEADKCLLRIFGAALTPVRGVRRYSDLAVGEKLYTVGSPSGFDLSLSDGLLSGLRREGSVDYVQTTAPISPGSSGGPLFDARGNLVGITTLILVGARGVNQGLNFAIAAEAFYSP